MFPFIQRQHIELLEREIEKLREAQKEQEMRFEAEKEQLKEQEENRRLREEVKSFIHPQPIYQITD